MLQPKLAYLSYTKSIIKINHDKLQNLPGRSLEVVVFVDIVLFVDVEFKSAEEVLFAVVEVKLALVELEVDVVVLVLVEVVVVELVVLGGVVVGTASTILNKGINS